MRPSMRQWKIRSKFRSISQSSEITIKLTKIHPASVFSKKADLLLLSVSTVELDLVGDDIVKEIDGGNIKLVDEDSHTRHVWTQRRLYIVNAHVVFAITIDKGLVNRVAVRQTILP